MKFVIVVLAVVLLAWLLFGRRRRGPPPKTPRASEPAAIEGMVRCAHCGVHLPASEALATGALHYCSDAHRERGPQAPRS